MHDVGGLHNKNDFQKNAHRYWFHCQSRQCSGQGQARARVQHRVLEQARPLPGGEPAADQLPAPRQVPGLPQLAWPLELLQPAHDIAFAQVYTDILHHHVQHSWIGATRPSERYQGLVSFWRQGRCLTQYDCCCHRRHYSLYMTYMLGIGYVTICANTDDHVHPL